MIKRIITDNKKSLTLTRMLTLLLIFVNILLFVQSVSAITGCYCNDPQRCYPDGCERKTWQGDHLEWEKGCNEDFCNGGGHYNQCYDTNSAEVGKHFCLDQPRCCFDMITAAKKGVAEPGKACCFPEIGYCHPFYCQQVGDPGGCGHYWEWHGNVPDWMAKGYGCVIGTSEQDLKPLFGLPAGVPGEGNHPTATPPRPTNTPVPTSPPFIPPTSIPTVYIPPTEYITPTLPFIPPTEPVRDFQIPTIQPYVTSSAPLPSSFPLFFPISLPSIHTEQIKQTARTTLYAVDGGLQKASYLTNSIKQSDLLLEQTVNQFIAKIISFFYQK